MTEALQEVLERVERLAPALQEAFAARAREILDELIDHERTNEAIARQNAEWAARLDDQLARAAQGENPIYTSEKAFFASLDAASSESQ
jgi:hypothetical protein